MRGEDIVAHQDDADNGKDENDLEVREPGNASQSTRPSQDRGDADDCPNKLIGRQGHDSKVVSLEAQGRGADEVSSACGNNASCNDGEDEDGVADPRVGSTNVQPDRRDQCGRICAHCHEASMSDGKLSSEAIDHAKANGHDDVDAEERKQLDIVSVHEGLPADQRCRAQHLDDGVRKHKGQDSCQRAM